MRRNTSSTQMERKEEGRGIEKDTFLSLFVRGQKADSANLVSSMLSVRQEIRSLLSFGEAVAIPLLWILLAM